MQKVYLSYRRKFLPKHRWTLISQSLCEKRPLHEASIMHKQCVHTYQHISTNIPVHVKMQGEENLLVLGMCRGHTSIKLCSLNILLGMLAHLLLRSVIQSVMSQQYNA